MVWMKGHDQGGDADGADRTGGNEQKVAPGGFGGGVSRGVRQDRLSGCRTNA
jgi:hypothetical protein